MTLMLALSAIVSAADNDHQERLSKAGKAFAEIMSAPDSTIPKSVLDKADCIAIIPNMIKGGFIVGGSFGRGAVTCRGAGKSGWGAPVMVEMGGGSVGLQIGASATDVVMLIMNRAGMESLLKNKFTIGGDASVAAGPIGRASTAETDAAMRAEILSYSRSRGVFAGVALKGTTLRQDGDATKALYGKNVDAKETLNGAVATPAAAKPLVQVLTKYSPKGV
jgi:lipid-binding SYLF domain-containing protein